MAERLEQTFNWARVGGAGLIFVLGPLFPNVGIAYVFGLGAFVLGYAAVVYWILRSEVASFERLTRSMFVIDIGIVSSAMLVFSSDPSWTTWMVGTLMIIAGGFRFGTAGAFAAAAPSRSPMCRSRLIAPRRSGCWSSHRALHSTSPYSSSRRT